MNLTIWVNLTSFERYGRQMDVETTLCAHWETNPHCFAVTVEG